MRLIFLLSTIILTLVACSSPQLPEEAAKKIPEKKDSVFVNVANFPIIADSSQFIADLIKTFNLEVANSSIQKTNEKITVYNKVKINGSINDYIFIEYDYGSGMGAAYPWKYQLVLNTKGKLVKVFSALRYEFVEVNKNENPYLLIVNVTYKGNGGHELYKLEGDTLENIYEGYYDYKVRTYDAHEDLYVFMPNELKLDFRDENKDGFYDMVFSGQKLMLGKYTKDSSWYDIENGKAFTVENPADKIRVKYTFLFDPITGHFK